MQKCNTVDATIIAKMSPRLMLVKNNYATEPLLVRLSEVNKYNIL